MIQSPLFRLYELEVLAAMRRFPRELFVPADGRPEAHQDHPISIGFGQTISQPYIVAVMTELLDPKTSHRVLEMVPGRDIRPRSCQAWWENCTALRSCPN